MRLHEVQRIRQVLTAIQRCTSAAMGDTENAVICIYHAHANAQSGFVPGDDVNMQGVGAADFGCADLIRNQYLVIFCALLFHIL